MRALVVTAPGEYGLTALPAPAPDVISLGQLRIQGAFASSPAAWRWMVSLYADGLFDPGPLVTHTYRLDEVATALAVLADRTSGALKVLILP